MRLNEITPGQRAVIADMVGAEPFVARRLLDMGIAEGKKVCMIRLLPFGGPLAIECDGMCVCIRRKDAAAIEVETLC